MSNTAFTKVPFLSGLDQESHAKWLVALNEAARGFTVCDVGELTQAERHQASVAIVANPSASQLAVLPNLVWVQSLWAGVEKLVNQELAPSLKIVRLVDDRLSETMAEAALAWALYLHRDMPLYRQQQDQQQWQQWPVKLAHERSVAVLGMGALGKRVAQKLSDTGFVVRGWSKNAKSANELTVAHFSGENGLLEILKISEIVIILLPLTEDTSGLLNEQTLSYLPSGASIINFARGPIINDDALLEGLNAGQLAHAVLDVFATEPLPEHHSFWTHLNITVLPHIAAPTDQTSASKIVANNLVDYFENGAIPTSISKARGY